MPSYHRHAERTFRNVGTTRTSSTSIAGVSKTTTEVPNRPLGYDWVKLGVEVELRGDSEYGTAESNPKKGSTFYCKGTVSRIENEADTYPGARPVKVTWDNATQNDYFFTDLDRYDTGFRVKGEQVDSLWAKDMFKEVEEKKGPMFNTGDIVFLKPGFHTAMHEHPALGTMYQCPGVVQLAIHAKVRVQLTVKWRNSLRSTYDIRYDTEKNPSKCALISGEDNEQLKQFVLENPNFAYKVTKGTGKDDFAVLDFFRTVMGIEEKHSKLDAMEHEQYHAKYFTIDSPEELPSDDEPDDAPEEVESVSQYVTFDFEAPPSLDTPAWLPSREFLNGPEEGGDTRDSNTEEE